jgi:hypothetical protein
MSSGTASTNSTLATFHPLPLSFDKEQTQAPSIQSSDEATGPQVQTEVQLDTAVSLDKTWTEPIEWDGLALARREESNQVATQGSCCSGNKTTPDRLASVDSRKMTVDQDESPTEESIFESSKSPRGSCCQSSSQQPSFTQDSSTKNLQSADVTFYPNLGPDSISTFQTTHLSMPSLPFSDVPNTSHSSSSVYSFPPPLSSWERPLTPEGLARIQRAGAVSPESIANNSISSGRWNSMGQSESFQLPSESYSTSLVSPIETSVASTRGLPSTPQAWPPINSLHVCQCGADCSCPMCPAHPYNKASAEALQSMAQAMSFVDPGSPTLNFNSQISDSGGILGMPLQDPAMNLNQFIATPLGNDQSAASIRNPDEKIQFPPQEAPVFTTAEYYHLYYPSAWIENNSNPDPH